MTRSTLVVLAVALSVVATHILSPLCQRSMVKRARDPSGVPGVAPRAGIAGHREADQRSASRVRRLVAGPMDDYFAASPPLSRRSRATWTACVASSTASSAGFHAFISYLSVLVSGTILP